MDHALRCLARREHGAHELIHKLIQKGHAEVVAREVLAECQRLNLQSDHRFVEMITRTRIGQGYGPLRIRRELQWLQIDKALIETVGQQEEHDWLSHARKAWEKKYGKPCASSRATLQKQKQFLLYRGFPMETINLLLDVINHH